FAHGLQHATDIAWICYAIYRPRGYMRGKESQETLAFTDKQIICRDCNTPFVFTAGEQEFYANKGLMNEPTRCPSCRSARRMNQSTLEQNDGYVRYGNFASFGGRTPRQMHPAQCASCDQITEVPFV